MAYQEKKCKKCGELKALDLYPKSNTCKDGRRGTCKECKKIYLKKYNKENKDHIKEINKTYKEKNKNVKPNARFQDLNKKIRECVKCGEVKLLNDFPKCKKSNNGHTWICKYCNRIRIKEWEHNNMTYVKNKRKEYKIKNKEKISQQNRLYDLKNKERRSFTKKRWQEKNKEYCTSKSKEYRQKNRYKRYQYELKYRSENQKKIKERRVANRCHHNRYIKNRRKNDLNFKIASVLRGRFKVFLKSKNIKATKKTLDLIGCSLDFFKSYIESKFEDGMSWDNHSLYTWHLDHLKPLSSFDLTDSKEQEKAMHYTNFQPLWAEDNLQKGAKLDWSPNE